MENFLAMAACCVWFFGLLAAAVYLILTTPLTDDEIESLGLRRRDLEKNE
jgi:hypothetical protein